MSAPGAGRVLPAATVEPRPHFGYVCSDCGPSEGMWRSEEDAAWAGDYHVHIRHGGPPVKPVPPSHWSQRGLTTPARVTSHEPS